MVMHFLLILGASAAQFQLTESCSVHSGNKGFLVVHKGHKAAVIDKHPTTPLNEAGKLWVQIFVIWPLKRASIGDYAVECRQISVSALA